MRIMILDDEALPRIALRNIVSKRYDVVGEAAAGIPAVDMALSLKPDVILVDIVLPDIDGFEFIDRVSQKLPNTKYLIISNVENIEYLKKAIKSKVTDYLIKGTVTEESLLQTLLTLEDDFSASEKNSTESSGNEGADYSLLINIFNKNTPVDRDAVTDYFGFSTDKNEYYCIVFKELETDASGDINNAMRFAQEIVMDSGEGRILRLSRSKFLCLFAPPEGSDAEASVEGMAYRITETLKTTFRIVLTSGISTRTIGSHNLIKAFSQAETAKSRCFYTGAYSVNSYKEYSAYQDRKDAAKLKKLIRESLNSETEADVNSLLSLLEELKNSALLTNLNREFIIGLYYDVVYYAFSLFDDDKDANYVNAQAMTQLLSQSQTLKYLHKTAVDILSLLSQITKQPRNEGEVVHQIKEYIRDNISEQLSLEDIAQHVFLNPTYLSQLFRKKTGEKLRYYITSERIKKAKEYLAEGESIHTTAELTGFASDSYFIQCFKDTTGFTPREYVRSHQKDQ